MSDDDGALKHIRDFWDTLVHEQRIQKHYSVIPGNHVILKGKEKKEEPKSGAECYFRIRINNLFLKDRRTFWKQTIPMVHSLLTFKYVGESKKTEIPLIVGSKEINQLGDQLNDVIDINKVLIGPVPYSGSEVEILLALFAIESQDYAAKFLNLLGTLSDTAGGGTEIKLALQFINPLKEGIEGLIGIGKLEPKVGLHDTIGFEKGSFWGVVVDTAYDLDLVNKLWVQEGRLFYRNSENEELRIYDKNNYFMFSFEWMNGRDDWKTLESIYAAYQEAIDKTGEGTEETVANNAFFKTVRRSADLTLPDKVIIIQYLKDSQNLLRAKPAPPMLIAHTESKKKMTEVLRVPFSNNQYGVKKMSFDEARKFSLADLEKMM
jgi:hypothetical protein